MTFNLAEKYDSDKLVLETEGTFAGRSLTAYCASDADGKLYYPDGNTVSAPRVKPFHHSRTSAPFPFDVVLDDAVVPQDGMVKEIAEELGLEFEEQFHDSVNEVYEAIQGEDDPVQAILDMGSEEIL